MEIRLENHKEDGSIEVALIDVPDPSSPINIIEEARKYAKANLDTTKTWKVFKSDVYLGHVPVKTVYDIEFGKIKKYETSNDPNGKTTFKTRREAEEVLDEWKRIKTKAKKRLNSIEEALDEIQEDLGFSMGAVATDSSGAGIEIRVEVNECIFTRIIY